MIVPVAVRDHGRVQGGFRLPGSEAPTRRSPTRRVPNPNRAIGAAGHRQFRRSVAHHHARDRGALANGRAVAGLRTATRPRLLDFPLMTDLREPLTERFHKAKIRADMLRPVRAEDLLDDRESAARLPGRRRGLRRGLQRRRGRSDSTSAATTSPNRDQQRIVRAQRLLRVAANEAATPKEREHAYDLARRELDGLIVSATRDRVGDRARHRGRNRPVNRAELVVTSSDRGGRPVNPRTACDRTKSATTSSSSMSNVDDGVLNNEKSIRANHSPAAATSRSLRTSPVSFAAAR